MGKLDDSDILRALYSIYKKLGQFIFHTYSLTCLNKDTTVLSKVKYKNNLNFFKNYLYAQNRFNKVIRSSKK